MFKKSKTLKANLFRISVQNLRKIHGTIHTSESDFLLSPTIRNRVLGLAEIVCGGCVKPAFTCSKLTIETLEQGVKHVQS